MDLCTSPECESPAEKYGRCMPHWRIHWAAKVREYRKRNPDSARNSDLKKNFGITLEQYNVMWEQQGGVCAICGNRESIVDNRTKRPRNLAVDHNHDTDEVRALLCMACNQGIGNFREDPEALRKAARYLETHKSDRVMPPTDAEVES